MHTSRWRTITNYKLISAALAVLAVVFIGAFAYTYNFYNNEVSTANQLSSEKQVLQAQLTAALANTASLSATIASQNVSVTSLTNQKTQLTSQVNSLNSQIASLSS